MGRVERQGGGTDSGDQESKKSYFSRTGKFLHSISQQYLRP